MYETVTSVQRTWQRNKQRAGEKNMLRLSPFEIEYEDTQKNNHAIAPTVLKKT